MILHGGAQSSLRPDTVRDNRCDYEAHDGRDLRAFLDEHVVGVQIAYKNDMDFSMGISLGSSIQVALLVTPILVFLGPFLGTPLRLIFTPLELGALGAAVVVTGFVALDGKSNWLEGAMLCGVYIIAALAFFFSP